MECLEMLVWTNNSPKELEAIVAEKMTHGLSSK